MRASKTGPGGSCLSLCLRFILVAVVLAPSACTHNHRGPEEVTAALERYAHANEGTADAYATVVTPPPTGTDPATPATMQAPRALSEFIRLALDQSPEIKAAELTAQAKAQRIAQVTSLPDPAVMTKTSPEPTRTAEGDSFFTLSISQRLPAPQKLDRAGRIALEQTRIALDRLREVRLGVIADVK